MSSPELRHGFRQIQQALLSGGFQNSQSAGDGQSALFGYSTASAFVDQEFIGAEFDGQSDRLLLTGVEPGKRHVRALDIPDFDPVGQLP